MKLFGNLNIRECELYIGNFSMKELKNKYGTPLYIIDENDFRGRCKLFKQNFQSNKFSTRILYAAKALLNKYIAQIIFEEDLFMDVVSGGEIFTAIKAGYPPEKMYFHGNNKLEDELSFAIAQDVGYIVIDNEQEVDNLIKIIPDGKVQKVLLRLNPGIEAHTHEYIATSKNDSKFGVSIFDEKTFHLIKRIYKSEKFEFSGFHCHIGSQIFNKESYFKESKAVIDFAKKINDNLGIKAKEINLGGGFGVYYTSEDKPFEYNEFLREYIFQIEEYFKEINFHVDLVSIEPGRSLISNSGSTLYTVGAVKITYGGKNYLFIDGGMTDNIRPALYQAKYEAIVANKCNEVSNTKYTIAGKCCESGDVIIKDYNLPKCEKDDLILVSSTGAYNYSMSMNYNKNLKPSMIFVGDEIKEAVRRQTYEDLIREEN